MSERELVAFKTRIAKDYPAYWELADYVLILEQERNNYKELYEKALKDLVKSDHTINELKKWLKEQDVFITELPAFTKEISIEHKTMAICYENTLDKMQEIEKEMK